MTPEEQQREQEGAARYYPNTPADPAGPGPAPVPPVEESGEGVAERYVAQELRDTRASLRRTQITSTLLSLFVMGYVGYVTANLRAAMEPKAAAQIAQGLIAERVDEQGPELIAELKRRVPALIAELPDYALRQMPEYREALEEQVATDMERHFTANSAELGDTVDELLTANKDDIKRMLEVGQDPEASREIGLALEQEFTEFLQKTPAGGGETIMAKMDGSLKALRNVEQRMDRLANAKDLTAQEKQARRAIALLSRTIVELREGSPPLIPLPSEPDAT